MKKSTLFAAVASAWLLTQPSLAACGPGPTATTHAASQVNSDLADALVAMNRENQARMPRDGNIAKFLDAYPRLDYTPATKKKLQTVFGSDHPISVSRKAGAGNALHYDVALPPHSYHDRSGLTTDWSALTFGVDTDKAGHQIRMDGGWDSLTFSEGKARAAMSGMRFATRQSRGADGLWYGDQHVHIDSLAFDHFFTATATVTAGGMGGSSTGAQENPISFDGIELRADMTRHGKFIDIGYASSVARISAGGEQIDDSRLAVRLLQLDPAAITRFKVQLQRVNDSGQAALERGKAGWEVMKTCFKDLVKRGASLAIDDFSASYRGHRAGLKGQAGFEQVGDQDFDQPWSLMNKLVLHFDVHVPVALVEDVARVIVGRQMTATLGQAPAQADIERGGKEMASGMIARMTGEGYVRSEDGELRSAIDFRGGKLLVNGKPVSFGAPAAAAGAAGPLLPPQEPAAHCSWPALPDGVAQADIRLEMVIDATGHSRDIVLAQGSGNAEFDAHAIAAAATCAWAPATRGGKPVAAPFVWGGAPATTDGAQQP